MTLSFLVSAPHSWMIGLASASVAQVSECAFLVGSRGHRLGLISREVSLYSMLVSVLPQSTIFPKVSLPRVGCVESGKLGRQFLVIKLAHRCSTDETVIGLLSPGLLIAAVHHHHEPSRCPSALVCHVNMEEQDVHVQTLEATCRPLRPTSAFPTSNDTTKFCHVMSGLL